MVGQVAGAIAACGKTLHFELNQNVINADSKILGVVKV